MSLIASYSILAVAAHPGSIGGWRMQQVPSSQRFQGKWENVQSKAHDWRCLKPILKHWLWETPQCFWHYNGNIWKPWLMLFDGAEHMISIVWCRPSMFRFSNLHTNPLTFERWCLLVGWAQVVHISTDEWCLPHPGPKQRGCELLRCSTLAARWTKPSGDSGHLFYFTDLFWRQCFVLPSFLLYRSLQLLCFWCVLLRKGKNAGFNVQRLKEKIGDKSNASSEVEYRNAWGVMIGEPGRGVRTIVTQPRQWEVCSSVQNPCWLMN